jgi:hypothetical protein
MSRYCIYDLLIWRPMSYGDLEVLLRSRVAERISALRRWAAGRAVPAG